MSSHHSRLPRLLACSAVLVSLFLNACSGASNALPAINSAHRSASVAPMALAAPMTSRCQTPLSAPRSGESPLGGANRRQSSTCCANGSISLGGQCLIFSSGPTPAPNNPAPGSGGGSGGSGGNGGSGGSGGGFGGTPIIGGGYPPVPPSPPCNPTCAPQPPHMGGGGGTPSQRFEAIGSMLREKGAAFSFVSSSLANNAVKGFYGNPSSFQESFASGEAYQLTWSAQVSEVFNGAPGAALSNPASLTPTTLIQFSPTQLPPGASGGSFATTLGSLINEDGSIMTPAQIQSAFALPSLPQYANLVSGFNSGSTAYIGFAAPNSWGSGGGLQIFGGSGSTVEGESVAVSEALSELEAALNCILGGCGPWSVPIQRKK